MKLQNTEEELDGGLREKGSNWSWGIGHRDISRPVYPIVIVTFFTVLNLACFIVGIVFIPLGGTFASIGGPLIVGALFSMAAFVSQFWAVAYQRYQEIRNYVYGYEWDELKSKAEERELLVEREKRIMSQIDKILSLALFASSTSPRCGRILNEVAFST